MKITGIKKKTPVTIIIFGLLLIIVTYYMGNDRILFLRLRERVWKYFSVPIDFGIPILLFSVFGLKKLFKDGNKKK